MPLDFPSSPTNGQKYGQYVYDSTLPGWRNVNTTEANTLLQVGLVPIVPSSVTVGSGSATTSTSGAVTFSGVSSVSLNGVFTSAYKNYRLVVSDINSASGNSNFGLRLRSSGSDNAANSYYQYWTMKRLNGTTQDNTGGPSTLYTLFSYDANTSYSWNWYGDITSPQAARNTIVTGNGFAADTTSTYNVLSTILHAVSSSFDGVTFIPTASTMSGTVQIYGYR